MSAFFSFQRVLDSFPLIIARLPVTLGIVVVSAFFGAALGTIGALIRLRKVPVLEQAFCAWVSFFRCTPILVQLFVVYFGVPFLLSRVGINANRWATAIFVNITFSLNLGAFLSEVIRGAVLGVDAGQREAALSVGLTEWQTFRRVIAPQALLIAMPSFSVILLALVQNTSLGFTIGLVDIVGTVRLIGVRTFHVFEGYVVAAVVFVVMSWILHFFFGLIEKRLRAKTARD